MADYTYFGFVLSTGAVLGEVPLVGAAPTWEVNGPGGLGSPSIKLGNLTRVQRMDAEAATVPYLCGIAADRDGRIVWSGVVTGRRYSSGDGEWRMTVPGLLDYWKVRLIATLQSWETPTDQFEIVRQLLLLGGNPTVPLVMDTTAMSGVPRIREIAAADLTPVIDEILQIADNRNGFELSIDSHWSTSPGTRRVEHRLRLGSPTLDGVKGLDMATLEYPGNVIDYQWDEDGGQLITDLWGSTQSDVGVTIIRSGSCPSMYEQGYPKVMRGKKWDNISEVATLDEHVAKALTEGTTYGNAPSFTVRDAGETSVGRWRVGDHMRVRITDERRFPALFHRGPGVDEIMRVVSASVTPGSNAVSVQMGPILPTGTLDDIVTGGGVVAEPSTDRPAGGDSDGATDPTTPDPGTGGTVPEPPPASTPGDLSQPLGMPAGQVAGLYYNKWLGPRMIEFPDVINLIYIAFVRGEGGKPGELTTRSKEMNINSATLRADIAAVRARGVRVLLSVGGEGGSVDMSSVTSISNLVDSIATIMGEWGQIDGLDWDLEGGAIASLSALLDASRKLKQRYGRNFIISAAPQPASTIYQQWAAQLGDDLDITCPQFYDYTTSSTAARIDSARGRIRGLVNSGVPTSKIGIGFRTVTDGGQLVTSGAGKYWSIDGAIEGWRTLSQEFPGLRGGFQWGAREDSKAGWPFATRVAPVILGRT